RCDVALAPAGRIPRDARSRRRRRQLSEQAVRRSQVLVDVEPRIDDRLDRAPLDEAHREARESRGLDAPEPPGLGPEDLVGHWPERLAIAAELGAHLPPDLGMARAYQPVLEEEPDAPGLAGQAMHL